MSRISWMKEPADRVDAWNRATMDAKVIRITAKYGFFFSAMSHLLSVILLRDSVRSSSGDAAVTCG